MGCTACGFSPELCARTAKLVRAAGREGRATLRPVGLDKHEELASTCWLANKVEAMVMNRHEQEQMLFDQLVLGLLWVFAAIRKIFRFSVPSSPETLVDRVSNMIATRVGHACRPRWKSSGDRNGADGEAAKCSCRGPLEFVGHDHHDPSTMSEAHLSTAALLVQMSPTYKHSQV